MEWMFNNTLKQKYSHNDKVHSNNEMGNSLPLLHGLSQRQELVYAHQPTDSTWSLLHQLWSEGQEEK